jgi:hypothetical protein
MYRCKKDYIRTRTNGPIFEEGECYDVTYNENDGFYKIVSDKGSGLTIDGYGLNIYFYSVAEVREIEIDKVLS